jgi:hypothetical protein
MRRSSSALVIALAAFCGASAHAEPQAQPAAPTEPQPGEARISVSGATVGVEAAAKPTTYNGGSEPSSSVATVTVGVQTQGVSTFADRHGLIELNGKLKVKVGAGNPADQNAGVSVSLALGFQLSAGGEVGYLPLDRSCSPYLSAGTGTEIKATVMDPLFFRGGHAPSFSTPDAQADIYLRAGAGLACISDTLVLIVTPYAALRADTLASGSGPEYGLRGTIVLPKELVLSLELATMSTRGSGFNQSTEKRASVSAKKLFGERYWVGLDATVADVNLKHTAPPDVDVSYEKQFIPFVVGIDVGFRFN